MKRMKQPYSYEADWRKYAFDEADHLATEEELKEGYLTVELKKGKKIPAGGLPVLCDGRTATLNTADEMTMIYGGTGAKKSRLLVSVLLCVLAMTEKGESMIIPDVKGELCQGVLAPKVRGVLKANGYRIRVVNLRDLNGDGWNLLQQPYELYQRGQTDEAMAQLHDLVSALSSFYNRSTSDPIWPKNAREYVMVIAVFLFEFCQDRDRINLLSLASYATNESCENLEKLAAMLPGKNNNIMTMLRSILSQSERTRMSTMATVASFFSDFIINEKLLRMLSFSTFEVSELYEQKTALFLILPDETDTYRSVTGLILSQISAALVKAAHQHGGMLPRRVNYICDEFCNYYIPGMDRNISAHRSRNIRWYLVCQSKSQLQQAYPKEYPVILANCKNIYFTGSPDPELLEELSEKAGYTNESEDGTPRRLISVSDLRKLKKGWESSEVYISSGPLTWVTELPDLDQYEFLQDYTEQPELPVYQYPPLKAYTSAEMLEDMYKLRQAYEDDLAGYDSEEDKELAEKYRHMFS